MPPPLQPTVTRQSSRNNQVLLSPGFEAISFPAWLHSTLLCGNELNINANVSLLFFFSFPSFFFFQPPDFRSLSRGSGFRKCYPHWLFISHMLDSSPAFFPAWFRADGVFILIFVCTECFKGRTTTDDGLMGKNKKILNHRFWLTLILPFYVFISFLLALRCFDLFWCDLKFKLSLLCSAPILWIRLRSSPRPIHLLLSL